MSLFDVEFKPKVHTIIIPATICGNNFLSKQLRDELIAGNMDANKKMNAAKL